MIIEFLHCSINQLIQQASEISGNVDKILNKVLKTEYGVKEQE